MYDFQYLRHRVVRGRGQPAFVYRFYDFQVIDVIAYVRHLVNLSAGLVAYAAEMAALVVNGLKQISELELCSSALEA